MQRGVLAAVSALVIGVYAYMAQSGVLELVSPNAADAYYNLLVQGLRAGQLSLKKEVPPGFAQLADPYDPASNPVYQRPPYRLLDLSYYKGKFYLYWGITPALILFWPYIVLTGHYLFHRQAVAMFCGMGFLVNVGLLCALWRRYFAEVSIVVVAACVLALGLATGIPALLSQCDVYEVPIGCGYMLTALALGAIWRALHEPERKGWWLAAASLAYGLAVGARPSLLFGALILLVPVAQAWRERRPIWAALMAATIPITLVGLGLMLYNVLRFDSPLEFGQHYQVSVERQLRQLFSLHYVWFNLRVYFLQPARWSVRSPFVSGAVLPPLPSGYLYAQDPFGVLSNVPLAWLALTVPLAWLGYSGQKRGALRWFVMAVCLLFAACALTLGFYCGAASRYEVDFLPALILLAVIGILGCERALAPTSESGQADRPVWRRAVRWGWSVLVGFSVVFNVLVTVGHYAEAQNGLATTLFRLGSPQDAIGHWEQALRLDPDYAEAHVNLGFALARLGSVPEAIGHYHQALLINPDYTEAHVNLGIALSQIGSNREAIGEYEQALRIKPDMSEVHYNLGNALLQANRVPEAIGEYEQALRINPDYAQAHYNLGVSLAQLGRLQEAMGHWEQALRIKPDYADAHNNLGNALLQGGKIDDAIAHYEQALGFEPGLAEAHCNLGVALERAGRLQDAIGHYEQALRIKPDFTQARNALVRLQARQ
ncbi:MAG: tetratricopeptide repeat protein [Verrucomicrobiia bacterium]